jgi:hypothetical protein
VDAYIMPLTFGEERQKEAAALRAAASQGGLRGYWRRRLDHTRRRPDSHDALALARLKVGDRDEAIASLERLSEQRGPWILAIKFDPQWDPLRADPRFQALLRKVKLVGSAP